MVAGGGLSSPVYLAPTSDSAALSTLPARESAKACSLPEQIFSIGCPVGITAW